MQFAAPPVPRRTYPGHRRALGRWSAPFFSRAVRSAPAAPRASFGRPGPAGLAGSAGWLGFVFSLVELPKKGDWALRGLINNRHLGGGYRLCAFCTAGNLRIMILIARILGELEPSDAATEGDGFEVLM